MRHEAGAVEAENFQAIPVEEFRAAKRLPDKGRVRHQDSFHDLGFRSLAAVFSKMDIGFDLKPADVLDTQEIAAPAFDNDLVARLQNEILPAGNRLAVAYEPGDGET